MTLEYKSTFDLETIMPILDEHIVWYGKIIKSFFTETPTDEDAPLSFYQWVEESRQKKYLHDSVIEKLLRIHQEMVVAAQKFITRSMMKSEMPIKEYIEFSFNYEEFIMAMRRVERDKALENTGFDEKTGLRSSRMMKNDINVELQRRARQGNPFSLGLLKINHFKKEWRQNPEICLPAIQKISLKIRECLRGFDDAYYMGDEYFLLSLKHADMIGAEAAIFRINQALSASVVSMPDDPTTEMTVSAVVYEIDPTDDLDQVVKNLKIDLSSIEQKSAVLKYNDVSPLQRHAQNLIKNNKTDIQ